MAQDTLQSVADNTSTVDVSTDSSSEQTIVRCIGLTKVFRDFWMRSRVKAVNSIDFDVKQGEVFGLLGPNGSGKSTTIKMILGLLHPSSGRIAVFAKHPRDVSIKKQIGYLPEESYLYPFLDARETLDYYGRLFHQNHRQRKQRIDMLLSMVGLDRAKRRPIGEYSKGMQRRIGLAQALINDPKLLILDEPTTGLDPIGTRQIKDLIAQLAQRGKSIILCSHLLADVEDVCDRVSIMFGGKIRKFGTVDELLTQAGMTTIEAEQLDSEDIETVEQALQQRGKHIEQVKNPRQKLEDLFLQIVHEAQKEGADTSGAHSGGKIAKFLVSKTLEEKELAPDEIISNLQSPQSDDKTKQTSDKSEEAKPEIHSQPEIKDKQSEQQKSVLDNLTNQPDSYKENINKIEENKPKVQPEPQANGESKYQQDKNSNNDSKEDESIIDSLLKSDKNNGQ